MNLSEKISSTRKAKGLKQAEVAKAMGISAAFYSKLEGRGNAITVEQLEEIAKAMQMSAVDVLKYGEEAEIHPTTEASEEVDSLRKRVDDLRSQVDVLWKELCITAERVTEHVAVVLTEEYGQDEVELFGEVAIRYIFRYFPFAVPVIDRVATELNWPGLDRWKQLHAFYYRDYRLPPPSTEVSREKRIEATFKLIRENGRKQGIAPEEVEYFITTGEVYFPFVKPNTDPRAYRMPS